MRTRSPLIFFVLLSLFALLHSELPSEVPARLLRGGLVVSVSPTSFTFSRSPVEERLSVNVTNPTEGNITVGLYYFDDGALHLIGKIGTVEAGGVGEFEIIAKFAYTGETTSKGRYAVVSERLHSAEFEIDENWEQYERRMATWFRYGSALIAPAIALLLIAAMVAFAHAAQRAERRGAYPGEYTLKTLFRVPLGRGLAESAVLVLAHPITWAFVCAVTVGTMAAIIAAQYKDPTIAVQIGVLSAPLAFAVPTLLLILTWLADRWEREPARFVVGMFVWGIVAAALSSIANTAALRGFAAVALFFGSLVVAPIVEELAKGAGVLLMSRHHELDDATDGLLYGFAVGLGFAAVENWYYGAVLTDMAAIGLEAWAYSIVYRSLFNTLAHGCFTAFVGTLIGVMKAKPRFAPHSALAFVPGLFIAIILHIWFNLAAIIDIVLVGRLHIRVFNPLLVLIIVAAFIVIWHFAGEETKKRVQAEKKTEAEGAEGAEGTEEQ